MARNVLGATSAAMADQSAFYAYHIYNHVMEGTVPENKRDSTAAAPAEFGMPPVPSEGPTPTGYVRRNGGARFPSSLGASDGQRRAGASNGGRGWNFTRGAPPRRRTAGWVVRAEETHPSRETASSDNIETDKAIRLATQRLESLLAGTGDGEDELMNNAMREVAPVQKTAAYCVAGGVVGSLATFLCTLLELDPYGGMDLSRGTLEAAMWGFLLAPPAMATQYMKWSPSVSERFPALTSLRELKEEEEGSLYSGMTDAQLAAITLTASFSACVFEISLLQGGVEQLGTGILANLQLQDVRQAAVAAALVLGTLVRGLAEAAAFEAETEEIQVISNALENCDRYYTVMDANKDNAGEMAAAFKTVAFVWFQQKKKAQVWAFWSNAFNIAYLIFLWRLTGNLASPIVALSMATYVDVKEYKKRHPQEFGQSQQ
eukprot:jgi/Tetstr1/458506/TSEL_044912.t1